MEHLVIIKVKSWFLFKRKQGLLFDLYAWHLLWQHFAWDFEEIGKKSIDELHTGMLFTGAVSYNRYKGINRRLTPKDAKRWIDDLSVGKMREISKVLMDSMKFIEPMKAAGVKKK